MNWNELIIHTTTHGADSVSSMLMDLGASGTQTEDRADIPDPNQPNGIWEIFDPSLPEKMPEDVLVHAWLEAGEGFPSLLAELHRRLDALKAADPACGTLQLDTRVLPEENWAESWKASWQPIRAGEHFVIKPTWEVFEPLPGDHVIEMDPGMAFGSGAHETTAMCLELLEKVVSGGEKVIDVGTGSGILAIGAAMLGANVLAVDIDPDAVRVAEENVRHNCMADRVAVREGDLLKQVEETCDICVANIIAQVICSFAAPLKSHIHPGGHFICSGIIADREADVREALLSAGYRIQETLRQGEWTALLAERPVL